MTIHLLAAFSVLLGLGLLLLATGWDSRHSP
jgi:hypothetical protein